MGDKKMRNFQASMIGTTVPTIFAIGGITFLGWHLINTTTGGLMGDTSGYGWAGVGLILLAAFLHWVTGE